VRDRRQRADERVEIFAGPPNPGWQFELDAGTRHAVHGVVRMHAPQVCRHHVEVCDPSIRRQRRRERVAELACERPVAAAEECSGPAIVGVAESSEAVHGNDDVDVRDERAQRMRIGRVVTMRRYVPPQVVGLDDRIQRRAGCRCCGLRDLGGALLETAVQGAEAEARTLNEAFGNPRCCEQLVEHRPDDTRRAGSTRQGNTPAERLHPRPAGTALDNVMTPRPY